MLKRGSLTALIEAATVKQERYSRSEVKFFSTIDIAAIQKQVDDLAKQYREIDSRIQQINWRIDLNE